MPYVAVEGCIASGKTTLAKALARRFGISAILEDYHDVPSLESFYKDPESHAFETEIQFTQSHFNLLAAALENRQGTPFVTDFSLKRDLVFARVTLEHQQEKQLEYKRFWQELAAQLPEPDWVIFLEAPVDELMRRIKARGRSFEQGISEDYLRRLVSGLREVYQDSREDVLIKLESTNLSELLDSVPNNLVGSRPGT